MRLHAERTTMQNNDRMRRERYRFIIFSFGKKHPTGGRAGRASARLTGCRAQGVGRYSILHRFNQFPPPFDDHQANQEKSQEEGKVAHDGGEGFLCHRDDGNRNQGREDESEGTEQYLTQQEALMAIITDGHAISRDQEHAEQAKLVESTIKGKKRSGIGVAGEDNQANRGGDKGGLEGNTGNEEETEEEHQGGEAVESTTLGGVEMGYEKQTRRRQPGNHHECQAGKECPTEIRQAGAEENFDDLVGGKTFADLGIPFECVAVDVTNGQSVVLREGDLASAIRASVSTPVIFAPVERDGRLLVDGAVLNPVPVDVAWDMGADTVIAVTNLGIPRSAVLTFSNDLPEGAIEVGWVKRAGLRLGPNVDGDPGMSRRSDSRALGVCS